MTILLLQLRMLIVAIVMGSTPTRSTSNAAALRICYWKMDFAAPTWVGYGPVVPGATCR
jgi:hypothetical protein